MRKRLVFVEQFYFPEGWGGAEMPRELTLFLAARGFNVEVICGRDQYVPVEVDSGVDPSSLGVRIRRIPSLFKGKAKSHKAMRQLWFYIAIIPMLIFGKRPAIYIAQTNPPLAPVLIAIAAYLLRRPLVIIAMDLYPEVAEAHGMLRADSLAGRMLFDIFRRSYRSAERVVALGPVMKRRLIDKGVEADRVVVISNWSTGAPGIVRGNANSLRREWNLEDRFVVVYSGNLGISHEFETLLTAVSLVRKSIHNIMLVVIGDGSRLTQVRDLVAKLDISDVVTFSKFLPAARIPESLGLADLGIVTLGLGYEGLVVPSKILSYMSRGIPILYIGPASDVDHYIGNCDCGISFRNGDVHGVVRGIVELHADPGRLLAMGAHGKLHYDSQFSREQGLLQYEALIHSCL